MSVKDTAAVYKISISVIFLYILSIMSFISYKFMHLVNAFATEHLLLKEKQMKLGCKSVYPLSIKLDYV